MYLLSIVLLIALAGFGTPVAQAQGVQQEQKTCPAPVLREKPTTEPAETCCPIDPKEVRKAQKAADEAGHKAAKACKKQQQVAAKAQRKVDEAHAKGNRKIDEANAKLERRKSEHAEAVAKLESLNGPNEGTAQAQSEPQTDMNITRSKPQPEPAPAPEPVPSPAPMTTPTPAPTTPEASPMPAPSSVQPVPAPQVNPPGSKPVEKQSRPEELPKTDSPMSLLGLIGLLSMSASYLTGFSRR